MPRAAPIPRRGRAWLVALALPLLSVGTAPAGAQSPAPPVPSPSPAVAWIRVEEIARRADTLLQVVATTQPDPAARRAIERVDRALNDAEADLDLLLQHARLAAAHGSSMVELEDLHRELAAMARTFEQWDAPIAAEIKRLAEVRDDLQRADEVWRATRERPETSGAGEVMVRRVDGSLAALAGATAELVPWRTHLLAISDRLLDRRTAVATASQRLEAAMVAERENLFVRTRPPIWRADLSAGVRRDLPQIPAAMHAYARSTLDYVERDARPVVFQIVSGIVAILVLRALAITASSSAARAVGDRPIQPYALGVLLALLATPWIHAASPQRFRQLLTMLALVPAGRIVLTAEGGIQRPTFAAVFLILLVDRMTLAVAPLPAVARVSAVLALALSFVIALWFARRLRRTSAPLALRRLARVAIAALGMAFLAELGGWSDLAALVGRGVVAAAVIAVFVHAAVLGLEPVIIRALDTSLLRRSRMLDRRRPVVRSRIGLVLRTIGTAFWALLVLRGIGLSDPALAAMQSTLAAGVSVGALSLSVGTLLAFVVTLVASMLFARLVTGILEEDVYPRTNLPRGVPFVLSTLARYAVYSFGFLFALAAAGIQLGQLTILVGGLGVGVGLGLQDLVKNFAAGLTLLLERRVHPGDIVQLPSQQIFGRVVAIGMRATLVKAWDGSEVVVPNGDLIASAITNWTLSDRLCRLEVTVGVAYGTEPQRVLDLLLAVARADERLLENPPPQALFVGFGESSLDFALRAWTDKGVDERVGMTSALALAVHRALTEAAIVIPFPQRDLHLASVAPEVGAALGTSKSAAFDGGSSTSR